MKFTFEKAKFISLKYFLSFTKTSKLTTFDSPFFINNFLLFHHFTSTFVASTEISKSPSFHVLLNTTGARITLSQTPKKFGKLSFIISSFAVVTVS